MSKKLRKAIPCVVVLAALSAPAMADEGELPDARVVLGYPQAQKVEKLSPALSWFVLLGLGIVCVGPLFLDAKRTR
jgi:hypothetical protein